MVELLSSIFTGSFFSNKFIRNNLVFSLILNVLTWLMLLFNIRGFDEVIPLHYNIYIGIDLIKPWYYSLLIPSLGTILLVLNLIIGMALYKFERLLSYFLVSASSFMNVLIVLVMYFILSLN